MTTKRRSCRRLETFRQLRMNHASSSRFPHGTSTTIAHNTPLESKKLGHRSQHIYIYKTPPGIVRESSPNSEAMAYLLFDSELRFQPKIRYRPRIQLQRDTCGAGVFLTSLLYFRFRWQRNAGRGKGTHCAHCQIEDLGSRQSTYSARDGLSYWTSPSARAPSPPDPARRRYSIARSPPETDWSSTPTPRLPRKIASERSNSKT